MERTSRFIRRVPFHPLFFAAYPVLALLAVNIKEVNPQVVWRPLLISLAGAIILGLLMALATRDWMRGAVATSFVLLLFFSYGHVYDFLEQNPLAGISLGRHRLLAPAYAVILLAGLWWIWRRLANLERATQVLNLVALFLLIFPTVQILSFNRLTSAGEKASVELVSLASPLEPDDPEHLPDVYYIVLDSYARADALRRDVGYDNSSFIDELQKLGFYVANCSRSNYSYTQASLTATLNLNYLPELVAALRDSGLEEKGIWLLLKNSLVRQQLSALGYKTVAFDTGYEWSTLTDADVFLGPARDSFTVQALEPFEAMLIKSTAGLILTDTQVKALTRQNEASTERINNVNFPFKGFAERQLYTLNQLPEVAKIRDPKFVFAHVLIPHVPFIFSPDGQIREDPGFYSGEKGGPINDEYQREGYVGQIQYINSRMLNIIRQILDESDEEPIIIIMGDTGLEKENRFQILNAYYLPGGADAGLYPAITPVNSFRLIFNTFFNTQYEPLPDLSYPIDDFTNVVPETSPDCTQ
jgi:hypothetical protein